MEICKACGAIAEWNSYFGGITCTRCGHAEKPHHEGMSYREAADRIEDHARIHYSSEGERCKKISDALFLAVNTLRALAIIQEGGELTLK